MRSGGGAGVEKARPADAPVWRGRRGMDDDVTDGELLVGGLGSEAQKIVGELLPAARVETPRTGEARGKRRVQDSGWNAAESSKDNENYQS